MIFGPNSSGKTSLIRALRVLKSSARGLPLLGLSANDYKEMVFAKDVSKKLAVGFGFRSHEEYLRHFGVAEFEVTYFDDYFVIGLLLGDQAQHDWAGWLEIRCYPEVNDELGTGQLYFVGEGANSLIEKHFEVFGKNIAFADMDTHPLLAVNEEKKFNPQSNLMKEFLSPLDYPLLQDVGFQDRNGVYWDWDERGHWLSDDGRYELEALPSKKKKASEFQEDLYKAEANLLREQNEDCWLRSAHQESWLDEEYLEEIEFLFTGACQLLTDTLRVQVLQILINQTLKSAKDFAENLSFGRSTRSPESDWSITKQEIDVDVLERVNESILSLTNGRYEFFQETTSLRQRQILIQGLRDNYTKVELATQNVGDGLHQVLPVLIEAFAASPVIQQPELHLHPKMQADLADVFLSRLPWPLPIFIETHSENLLLRIQKRIREGKAGSEDIKIIYCESEDGKRNRATNIGLSHVGDVLDPFPISFADVRLQDLL